MMITPSQECIYELAKNMTIQKQVRAELADFQSAKGHFPSYDDLMSGTVLPYFEAVIRETLRTKAVLREVERMVRHLFYFLLDFNTQVCLRQYKTMSFHCTFPLQLQGARRYT